MLTVTHYSSNLSLHKNDLVFICFDQFAVLEWPMKLEEEVQEVQNFQYL
jgi:hypothetical protein